MPLLALHFICRLCVWGANVCMRHHIGRLRFSFACVSVRFGFLYQCHQIKLIALFLETWSHFAQCRSRSVWSVSFFCTQTKPTFACRTLGHPSHRAISFLSQMVECGRSGWLPWDCGTMWYTFIIPTQIRTWTIFSQILRIVMVFAFRLLRFAFPFARGGGAQGLAGCL